MPPKGKEISGVIRDNPPCRGCTEKYIACHDHCKKFKAWKAEIERVKAEKQKYLDNLNVRKKKHNGGNYG